MSRIVNAFTVALLVLLAAAAAHAALRTDANGNVIWDKPHIDLTLKVSDDISGVAKVELWWRQPGGAWQKSSEEPRPGQNPGQFIAGFDAPDDGTYEFYSVTIDKVGNSSGAPTDMTQPRIIINFDTKAPELQVNFDKDYKTVTPGTTLDFNWTAKDANLKKVVVRHYWNGEADKPSEQPVMGDSGPFSLSVPSEGVTKMTLIVSAEDYAGHMVTTQAFSFDVKTPETPPAAPEQNTTPANNANVQETEPLNNQNAAAKPREPDIKPTALQVAIKYDVVQSGATGLDRVELWYTKVGQTDWKKKWTLYQFSTNGKGTFVFEAPELAEYGFYVIAQNRAGQWSKPRPDGQTEIEPDYTKWVDPYAPFLKVLSPKAGECLRGGSEVAVRWVANDDNLLEKPVKIELFSGDKSVLVVENATENDGVQSFLFPYKSGKYSIRVTATDRAGHVTEESTGEFLIDSGNIAVSIEVLEEEYIREGMGIENSGTPPSADTAPADPPEEKSYAPEATVDMTDKDARDAYTKGMALKAKGSLEEAAALLKSAAAHFPNDDTMVNEYGVALYGLKHYSEALEQFNRAVPLAPGNSGYLWNVFLANYGLKNLDGASQAAIDVLAADPNWAQARNMIDVVITLYDDNGRSSEVNAWLWKIIDGSHISDSLKTYVRSRMR
jgi:hypothetical protein